MDIKFKSRIQKCLGNVWSVEIVIAIIIGIVLLLSYVKEFKSYEYGVKINSFNAIFNKKDVIKGLIYMDSYEIAQDIYAVTDNLKRVNKDEIESTILNRYNVMYVLVDKKMNKIYTNNDKIKKYYEENNSVLGDGAIYIRLKNLGCDFEMIDNSKKYNCYVDRNRDKVDIISLSDFTEFYFVKTGVYDKQIDQMALNGIFLIIVTIIEILLILKIIIVTILNPKEFKEKINVAKKIFYVLSKGFIYKHSNRKLKITLIATVFAIMAYLYLVAGIGNQNILITFLTQYPFKGTLVILMIPLLCLIYSLKKTIDVEVINELLKKVKDGDLELTIEYSGENEIKELVDNINEIKKGYKIAVNEKVKNEKFKSDLITNISHDVKTPLTSIINYINILKREDLSDEERLEYLSILENKSGKLKILIEDLFEISKLNSGKMKVTKEEVNIVALIDQVVGEASTLYVSKNITFKVVSHKDDIYLDLDGMLISRVFENAIVNALKYSLENTRVFIEVEELDKEVKIIFKNIANYQMDFDKGEIFERFVRADKSRNSSVEGSGIGLAIAKNIIDLHEGRINIDLDGDMFKLIIELPKN